jgi:hypothetical protein
LNSDSTEKDGPKGYIDTLLELTKIQDQNQSKLSSILVDQLNQNYNQNSAKKEVTQQNSMNDNK